MKGSKGETELLLLPVRGNETDKHLVALGGDDVCEGALHGAEVVLVVGVVAPVVVPVVHREPQLLLRRQTLTDIPRPPFEQRIRTTSSS